ncbi:MAG TPA: preprotein translocase subunit SecA [Dehalococcoidia bacterium]|nr:preprotein translocase subunit SecA [Dehalococcoidia bacterium]
MSRLGFINRIIGDSNEKELKRLGKIVAGINELADETESLSDDELAARSVEFRERLAAGENLEDILPESFATVREAAARLVEERPYDVQLMGAISLHEGKIAEMRTGEGKTLTAVSAVYLNALAGKGVHIVTVNDYLARRDAIWYAPVYTLLGMTVGVIQNNFISYMYEPGYRPEEEGQEGLDDLRLATRHEVYRADITYGTNNEFGFDYLRDNMLKEIDERTQRPLHFAIVDEVDNILIDESRTPLIISGHAEEASTTYMAFARGVRNLSEGHDFVIDHKAKHVALTEDGIERLEKAMGISNLFADAGVARHLEAALDAQFLKQANVEYVVKEGEIVIVDEFTGRMMPGRRWSHGIHQAIEAKEGLTIQRESITYATVTFQNFFRLYDKLAGMTGTAETEAEEFHKIYGLDVIVIPTHRPMIREDHPDVVYINERAKFNAVVSEIEEMQKEKRPVLVGTTSIEKSEYLAGLLKKKGIAHDILNAKQHEHEAQIVANAGQGKAVVIATNMAGRGTDIKLGPEVADHGGLHVIGTERHESRRIDNQLRGRSGRQGDPGSSRFFVSFGDDIMKRFAPDWVPGMMQKFGMTEDTPLESSMVGRAIAQAQQKVEGHNFDIRKRLVEFDDVINEHRTVIYGERDKILLGADTRANLLGMMGDEIEAVLSAVDESPDMLEVSQSELREILPPDDIPSIPEMRDLGEELIDEMIARSEDRYEQLEELLGEDNVRAMERALLLESIDFHWRQHLTAIDDLRTSIGLQAYAQQDPLVAFKREAYDMYQQLQNNIRRQVARTAFRVKIDVKQTSPSKQAASGNGSSNEPAAGKAKASVPQSTPAVNTLRTNKDDGGRLARRGGKIAKKRRMLR